MCHGSLQFNLWFDPSKGYHDYTFMWGWNAVVFLVDGRPIRVIPRQGTLYNNSYIQKPMQAQVSTPPQPFSHVQP